MNELMKRLNAEDCDLGDEYAEAYDLADEIGELCDDLEASLPCAE